MSITRTVSTRRHLPLLAALGFVALSAAACTYYAEPATSPSTSPASIPATPSSLDPTSVPSTEPATPSTVEPTPTSAPPATWAQVPTSAPNVGGAGHETIRPVIEDERGVQLCFRSTGAAPPTCESGVALDGWSWADIDVERVEGGTTWVDQIYVRGSYDPTTRTLAVEESRLPTDDDRERVLLSAPLPDHRLPCEPPPDGWPERTDPFPADTIAALDGYAGSWSDPSGQVMVVAVTGDPAAAERSIRTWFDDGLCIVSAPRSAADLAAVQRALPGVDGLHLLASAPWVDASGAWVRVDVPTYDHRMQLALDELFGQQVVRLNPALIAVDV